MGRSTCSRLRLIIEELEKKLGYAHVYVRSKGISCVYDFVATAKPGCESILVPAYEPRPLFK